jgi:hypothetical protein
MGRSSQTDDDKRNANAADTFTIKALEYFKAHGVKVDPVILAINDPTERGTRIAEWNGLCAVLIGATQRRINSRNGLSKGMTVADAFANAKI